MNQDLQQVKSKILNIIRIRGPSLPVHIGRETGLDILFSSALLSELAREKEIKISNLKVGGSPLYFLQGQEFKLESFYNYLPGKEKEAFLLLKQKKILEDRKQEPAIRVALRNIKDFAVPLILKTEGQEQQLFWRFYSLAEQEALEKIKPKKIKIAKIKKEIEKPILELKPIRKIAKEIKKPREKSEFAKKIISLLQSGNIEILEEKEIKKREFLGTIRINSELGKLNFLCIAKDKKRITENDLTLALQKSQSLKLPALVLSPGEMNKKALSYLEQNSGLIKFKRISED